MVITKKEQCITTDDYGNRWHICKEYHTYATITYWHREDGPAIEPTDGRVQWYINGGEVKPENMPLRLFIAYCKYQYSFYNGSQY